MILGIDKLHKLVKDKKLVENLCQRELENPEGAGFDLRLGEIYELKSNSFLGVEERKTPDINLLAEFKDRKQSFIFKPGKYYLMRTVERVNTPEDIMIIFRPRTTVFRSGMMIFTGNVAPGYCGKLIFGIINLGPVDVEIELGARVVHAMFYKIDGKTHLYKGQWQNGRVTSKKKEKQI